MPRRSRHHTESVVRPPAPTDAKGGPLSERMAAGKPNSRKAESKMRCTSRPFGSSTPSQRTRKSRVSVEDGERITDEPILRVEVALEVHAPRRVGSGDVREGLRRSLRRAHALQTPWHRQPAPPDHLANRALRGELGQLRILLRKPRSELDPLSGPFPSTRHAPRSGMSSDSASRLSAMSPVRCVRDLSVRAAVFGRRKGLSTMLPYDICL